MARTLALSCLGAALLLTAAPASAAVVLLQDDRLISTGPSSDTPDVPFEDWASGLALSSGGAVFQESRVGTTDMFGGGLASTSGVSQFDVTFETTTPIDILWEVSFESTGSVLAEARIQTNGTTLLGGSFDPNASFTGDDVLDPGVYRVLVSVTSEGGIGSYEFGLNIVPVPEPGTAALLALGLAGLSRAAGRGGRPRGCC